MIIGIGCRITDFAIFGTKDFCHVFDQPPGTVIGIALCGQHFPSSGVFILLDLFCQIAGFVIGIGRDAACSLCPVWTDRTIRPDLFDHIALFIIGPGIVFFGHVVIVHSFDCAVYRIAGLVIGRHGCRIMGIPIGRAAFADLLHGQALFVVSICGRRFCGLPVVRPRHRFCFFCQVSAFVIGTGSDRFFVYAVTVPADRDLFDQVAFCVIGTDSGMHVPVAALPGRFGADIAVGNAEQRVRLLPFIDGGNRGREEARQQHQHGKNECDRFFHGFVLLCYAAIF